MSPASLHLFFPPCWRQLCLLILLGSSTIEKRKILFQVTPGQILGFPLIGPTWVTCSSINQSFGQKDRARLPGVGLDMPIPGLTWGKSEVQRKTRSYHGGLRLRIPSRWAQGIPSPRLTLAFHCSFSPALAPPHLTILKIKDIHLVFCTSIPLHTLKYLPPPLVPLRFILTISRGNTAFQSNQISQC